MGDHGGSTDASPTAAGPAAADGATTARGAMDVEERRAALLLAALRLSRDPGMLPRLEAALAPLDDGRRPRAAWRAERRLIRGLHERVVDTLGEDDGAAWDAERDAEAAEGAAGMDAVRRGLAPRAGTPPEAAAAMRAAGELQARLDGGEEPAVPGAATAEGWTVVARLELEGGLGWLPADLWALRPPPPMSGGGSGGKLSFVAAGGLAPEVWSWPTMLAEVHARRAELAEAEAFVRDALAAFLPAHAAGRAPGAGREGRLGAGRRTQERRGAAVLHLLDGRPVRAEGAALLGPGGEEPRSGVEARRVDPAPVAVAPPAGAPGGVDDDDDDDDAPPPPPDRPWAEQVWARPLGDGAWRRGRLQVEPGRVAFVDEPEAGTGARGDGAPPGGRGGRTLERDLLGDAGIRRRAAGCAVYARLLHAALESGRWRHAEGAAWTGGRRPADALVARLAGGGDQLDRTWGGLGGVLDEGVLADLGALGWAREADG